MSEPLVVEAADRPLIRVEGLGKSYNSGPQRIDVLRDVNLKVYPGEIVGVMGPSGSGKTTLLNILGLFLSPSRGTYLFGGRDVLSLNRSAQASFRRHEVGFVFQFSDLLEHSTVHENLEFPLIYARVRRRERRALILTALTLVNLGHRIHHKTNLLSGGERQRVAVARALVNRPRVILADEPTGHLDRENSNIILDYFQEIARQALTAIVLITHDTEVAGYCHRTYHLENGVLIARKPGPHPRREVFS
jgi:ABC-type lipoprotein export system ATPase subunit